MTDKDYVNPRLAVSVNASVGSRLSDALAERQITHQQLADRIGTDAAQIERFCLGQERIRPDILARICGVLGLRMAWFFQR